MRVHTTLTNYARGYAQDLTGSLAKFICPDVQVGAASGKFKRFSDKNDFALYDTRRAVGGPARRIEWGEADGTYDCAPHALEATIDDQERERAAAGGGTDPFGLEKGKISSLISSAVLSHEAAVLEKARTVSAESGKGIWGGAGGASNNPIVELDALIEARSTAIGRMLNRMAIGLPAWNILRNHPKVIERFPGAASIGVTTAQFASLLLNPNIDIRIGILGVDANKPGKARSVSNMVGADIFVFLGTDTPTLYDASFMKCFRTQRGGVDKVYQYREPANRSDVFAVDWSEDVQVVSSISAFRITVTSA